MHNLRELIWNLVCLFWIASPVIFFLMRLTGVYNFKQDSLIFCILAAISFLTMFLTFKGKPQ